MLYLSSIVESPSRHRSIYFFMDLVSVPASRRHLTIFTQPKSSSENCLILFLSLWTNGKKPHFAQNLNVCSDISSFWATSFILYIIIIPLVLKTGGNYIAISACLYYLQILSFRVFCISFMISSFVR